MSDSTAARVRSAAKALGYIPNHVARSLAEGQNRILGVFTYEPVFAPSTVDHYSPYMFGIEQECEALGYDLLLVSTPTAATGARAVTEGAINRLDFTDGGILFGHEPDVSDLERLAAMGYPYVFIGRRELPEGEVLSVYPDYGAATKAIVELMLSNGHRKFVYVGLDTQREYARDREQGFHAGIASHEDASAITVWRGDTSSLDAGKVVGWLSSGVTALVFETPGQARGVLEILGTLGSSEAAVSFAVLADVHYGEVSPPEWATVVIPRVAMGRAAVRLLREHLSGEGPPLEPVAMPCDVRVGSSIRPIEKG